MSQGAQASHQQRKNKLAGSKPDLIDVFIILLLASATDIFIFWMATQLTNNPVLQHLPVFIVGVYSGIWSSVATGTAGIGLLIVKALALKSDEHPNYIVYVITLAVTFFIAIMIVAWTTATWKHTVVQVPPNVVTLAEGGTAPLVYDLESPPGSGWVRYTTTGNVRVEKGHVFGHSDGGTIVVGNDFKPQFEMIIEKLSIVSCYVHNEGGNEIRDVFPPNPKSNASVMLGVVPQTGMTFKIPAFDFSFNLPPGAVQDKVWLCGMLWNNDGNGYYPAE